MVIIPVKTENYIQIYKIFQQPKILKIELSLPLNKGSNPTSLFTSMNNYRNF